MTHERESNMFKPIIKVFSSFHEDDDNEEKRNEKATVVEDTPTPTGTDDPEPYFSHSLGNYHLIYVLF